MSIESDAASQVASIYSKGVEEAAHVAVKIGGEVFEISKELAVVLFRAIALQDFQRSGKISLHNMLRKAAQSGSDLHVVTINSKEEFDKVAKEFKSGSVLFAQGRGKGNYNIVFGEDNAPLVNRALKNLNLNVVDGEIVSSVNEKLNLSKEPINLDKLSLKDEDFQTPDTFDKFEKSVTPDKEKKIIDTDIQVSKQFDEYDSEKYLNLSKAEEYDDPDKFAKDLQKAQKGKESPLAKDGEAAAPSKKKSAAGKSNDKVKTSIHEKVAHKKAERAVKAKESVSNAKERMGKAVEAVKEVGGK